MEAIRFQEIIEKDGEVAITGLPYKKGQLVDIIVFPQIIDINRPSLTVSKFRQSGVIGMWQDRDDITDSSVYARQLREDAQSRRQ
ncbi:MAG: hypothetical protein HQK67_09405, partial [Desulfamplus sp.]|nr:hypothetical protein [Desulfamplus sp.]